VGSAAAPVVQGNEVITDFESSGVNSRTRTDRLLRARDSDGLFAYAPTESGPDSDSALLPIALEEQARGSLVPAQSFTLG
jgi:hypothetical protein